MDFYTIERNLKAGEYQTASQFHADVNKIWYNSIDDALSAGLTPASNCVGLK
jgi:hypothetical protein